MTKANRTVQDIPVVSFHPRHKFSPVKKLSNHPDSLSASPLLIQPKLAIGEPDDRYEREADRIAETVTGMPEPKIQRA